MPLVYDGGTPAVPAELSGSEHSIEDAAWKSVSFRKWRFTPSLAKQPNREVANPIEHSSGNIYVTIVVA